MDSLWSSIRINSENCMWWHWLIWHRAGGSTRMYIIFPTMQNTSCHWLLKTIWSVGGMTINNLRYTDDSVSSGKWTRESDWKSKSGEWTVWPRFKCKQDKGDDCQPTRREPIYSCRKPSDWNNQSVQLPGSMISKQGTTTGRGMVQMFHWNKARNYTDKKIQVCYELEWTDGIIYCNSCKSTLYRICMLSWLLKIEMSGELH